MVEQTSDEALEYTRNLHKLVLNWYGNADTKAQILLTIDGAFLAFLTSSIFAKPAELSLIIDKFRVETWTFLGLMSICLVGSIMSALNCLRSRTYSARALQAMFDQLKEEKKFNLNNADTYGPEVMGFFQVISKLNEGQFVKKLSALDRDFIINVLGSQIRIISGNVYEKHHWVNIGFFLAGLTLVLFLGGGISYLLRIHFTG